MLRILPEVDVSMVEDVCVLVQVEEGLGGEDHAHIVTCRSQQGGIQNGQ